MIKGILFFVVVWIIAHAAIVAFRKATMREKWNGTKTAVFAASTAFIASVAIWLIVVIF
jgi:hypothetical protein